MNAQEFRKAYPVSLPTNGIVRPWGYGNRYYGHKDYGYYVMVVDFDRASLAQYHLGDDADPERNFPAEIRGKRSVRLDRATILKLKQLSAIAFQKKQATRTNERPELIGHPESPVYFLNRNRIARVFSDLEEDLDWYANALQIIDRATPLDWNEEQSE